MQVFAEFYEKADVASIPVPGDIYWVPSPAVDEVPRILDVRRADPVTHEILEYEILQIHGRHFTERADRLPIKLLPLTATEELVVAKAKKRPCVILFANRGANLDNAPAVEQRLARPLGKTCYVVAPFQSTSVPQYPGAFMPTFVARIRAVLYPQFVCLPPLGSKEARPGEIVRLDRLFATHLARGCDRAVWRVHPEVFALVRDQLVWALTGTKSEYLSTVIETARDALPPEMK